MLRDLVIGFGPLLLGIVLGQIAPRFFPGWNRYLVLIAGTMIGLAIGALLAYPLSEAWPK
jgi:hypothetical protein